MNARWVRPVIAPITQIWGNGATGPNGAGGHPGTDYGCPMGTPIKAASDGTVIYAGPASGFGDHAVSIWHPADGVTTTYGHMEAHFVWVGQHVAAGDVIGLADSQGFSTGSHLHFEVRRGFAAFGGNPPNIDSDLWLRQHGAYGPADPAVLVSVVVDKDPFMAMPTINTNGPLDMAHPDVATAQGLLAARGGWISPINRSHPVFSTVTRWFQGKTGLAVDGVIGDKTWYEMSHPKGSNAR